MSFKALLWHHKCWFKINVSWRWFKVLPYYWKAEGEKKQEDVSDEADHGLHQSMKHFSVLPVGRVSFGIGSSATACLLCWGGSSETANGHTFKCQPQSFSSNGHRVPLMSEVMWIGGVSNNKTLSRGFHLRQRRVLLWFWTEWQPLGLKTEPWEFPDFF